VGSIELVSATQVERGGQRRGSGHLVNDGPTREVDRVQITRA
jgi:hypothetical protein